MANLRNRASRAITHHTQAAAAHSSLGSAACAHNDRSAQSRDDDARFCFDGLHCCRRCGRVDCRDFSKELDVGELLLSRYFFYFVLWLGEQVCFFNGRVKCGFLRGVILWP